jgi:hypothetical protein
VNQRMNASQEYHQLKSDRYGLGSGAYPYLWGTPGLVDVASREAIMNFYGVVMAMPQEQSWVPNLSNYSGMNVGTIRTVPLRSTASGSEGKIYRRLMLFEWGGGVVVVRDRESRSHGEGPQCVVVSEQDKETAGEY